MSSHQRTGGRGGGWLIDYGGGGLVEEVQLQPSDFIWNPPHILIDDPTTVSGTVLGFDVLRKEDNCPDNAAGKKRSRVESCAAPGTKACREKMRRDRLNDRFAELCSILDPGKPPKADKVAILIDATRLLNQLRLEAKKLKESNEALQGSIKNLKAEKMELRDEKVRLKAVKERIEQMVKGTSVTPPFDAQSAAATIHAAPGAAYGKAIPYPNYVPIGMWQWIPPAALDTSQDHVLRPPVA